MKGASPGEWGLECDKAFQAIKDYLASPLILSQPVEGEEIYLYLKTLALAVSATFVWASSDDGQRPVYFVSKMLTDVETRYTSFERIVLALKMEAKKLLPYFQVHKIVVLTSYLIRAILYKPDASRILLKWAIELRELDIVYHPRSTIKGQVFADFMVEMSDMPQDGINEPL